MSCCERASVRQRLPDRVIPLSRRRWRHRSDPSLQQLPRLRQRASSARSFSSDCREASEDDRWSGGAFPHGAAPRDSPEANAELVRHVYLAEGRKHGDDASARREQEDGREGEDALQQQRQQSGGIAH